MSSRIRLLLLGLLGPGALLLGSSLAAADEPAPPPADGAEVLARGPVHEAFAAPTENRPLAGAIIAKKPPDPIEELPPDQKPEGTDVRWIPGYWYYDQGDSNYLWVSGFWRDEPPGQRWVPGTWQEVEGGWQWSSGFWTPATATQANYVPTPPPTIDAGPSTAAPDETSTYAPGCWVYQESRFLWRPGHWVAYRPDWVWVPAHYVWTHGGCVFVEGFWDRPLELRGLLFAPVRFTDRLVRAFTPRIVVRADFLLGALFVGPARHHYYFGDYFGEGYEKKGFVSWVDYRPSRGCYDPVFSYYRAAYHGTPTWEKNLHELYGARRTTVELRPPHTFVQQEQVLRKINENRTTNVNISKTVNITHVQNVTALAPLKEVHTLKMNSLAGLAPTAKVEPHTVRLATVSKEEITRNRTVVEQTRVITKERTTVEAKIIASPPAAKPVHLELPKTTVVHVGKAPPLPVLPKHEEKPIPKHTPPEPPKPPHK